MKSILIGDPAMCKHAFPASVRTRLTAWTQLPDVPVTREEILAQPNLYRDTELIFSTWDMPHFTREELQERFPALRAVFYAAGSVQHFAREFLAAGVHVFSAWAANAIPVAEYAAAQILLANKGFHYAVRASRSPEGRHRALERFWQMPGSFDTPVGILGAGMVGRSLIGLLKQKLCLHITLGTRYHALCTQLLQQRGGFQRVLKITADGHDADVKISDAKRAKKLRVCTVANLCVGDIWQHITDSFLVCIDRHDLMPQLRKLYCDMPSEAACANQ